MKNNIAKILLISIILCGFLTISVFAAMVEPEKVKFEGRKGWKIANDKLEVIVLEGGGHIVSAKLLEKGSPEINPYWIPHWKSMEPSDFKPEKHGHIYGDNHEGILLAGIMGHNICLDFFGVPSKAEFAKGGITVHGEGPIVDWKVTKKWANENEVGLAYGAELPKAQLHIERTVILKKGEPVFHVREKLTNRGHFDRPFGWCQHVTFGAPFVKGGVTLFDTPAMRSTVAPFKFHEKMRYKMGEEFRWPFVPGSDGKTKNWRIAASETVSSDFTVHLMDPNMKYAYFTAANPEKRLMVGYVWERKDFPWLANWEENHARTHKPWKGKGTTRGMEFSNTPLVFTRRSTVEQGELFDTPTYAWIEAGQTITTQYIAFLKKIPSDFRGTGKLDLDNRGIKIWRFNGKAMTIPCVNADKIVK